MRKMPILTKEPIKINLLVSEHGNDHSIELTYKNKNYLYAFMTQDRRVMLDLSKIRYWVEETYYSLDFLSPQYVPCELKAESFEIG